MQRVAKKATAIVATAAAVGFSSLFLAAAPATAAPVTCGNGATMLTGGICELTVTATGPTVFTPTTEVSQLEALLVAGGGSGSYAAQGYGAGGGGEVKVVGFADTVTPIDLTVGAADTDTTATQGAVVETAAAGNSAGTSSSGGSSGNGNTGAAGIAGAPGAGGGAGATLAAARGIALLGRLHLLRRRRGQFHPADHCRSRVVRRRFRHLGRNGLRRHGTHAQLRRRRQHWR
jgi:hypothetical protein